MKNENTVDGLVVYGLGHQTCDQQVASLIPGHALKKGKVDHATPGRRWGAHLPLIAFEPVGG